MVQMDPQVPMDVTDDDKLWGALSWAPYIGWIAALVILFTEDKKQRSFMKYNAVLSLAFAVVAGVLSAIGSAIFVVPGCIVAVAWLAYAIYLALEAYKGKWVTVPVLTDFCKGQGWIS